MKCETDGINEANPRVVDEARARKLASDLRRCSYYETCATYGLNIERVFQDGNFTFVHFISFQRIHSSLSWLFFFSCAACQKIVQQRLTPLAAPSAGVATAPRPTTPNHYSLGRHFGQHSTGNAAPPPGSGTVPAGYPGSASGFSSSSLGSVVAGSTLGPAGAGSIGTGHSSLAGYNNNGSAALSGSALNLHSSTSASSQNGALAARGK